MRRGSKNKTSLSENTRITRHRRLNYTLCTATAANSTLLATEQAQRVSADSFASVYRCRVCLDRLSAALAIEDACDDRRYVHRRQTDVQSAAAIYIMGGCTHRATQRFLSQIPILFTRVADERSVPHTCCMTGDHSK